MPPTWYWSASEETLSVWDHTQDPSTDSPVATRTQTGGWSWAAETPPPVYDILSEQIDTARSNGNSDYVTRALQAAVCGHIRLFQE